jgi:hypothetical protein
VQQCDALMNFKHTPHHEVIEMVVGAICLESEQFISFARH